MFFNPVLSAPLPYYSSLYDIIRANGLTSNLKTALDIGDIQSYKSGQNIFDRSVLHYKYLRGADNTATTDDPTFNGTLGLQSANEYLSFDGGDYISYDATGAPWIEQWMLDLAKTGSLSCFGICYLNNTVSPTYLFSTRGSLNSDYGVSIGAVSSFGLMKLNISWTMTSGGPAGLGSAGPTISSTGLYVFGASSTVDGAGNHSYVIHVNGTNYTASGNLGSTLASNDAVNAPKIFARGDAGAKAPSGSRLYALAVWQGRMLSTTDFTNLWNGMHTRFGI